MNNYSSSGDTLSVDPEDGEIDVNGEDKFFPKDQSQRDSIALDILGSTPRPMGMVLTSIEIARSTDSDNVIRYQAYRNLAALKIRADAAKAKEGADAAILKANKVALDEARDRHFIGSTGAVTLARDLAAMGYEIKKVANG